MAFHLSNCRTAPVEIIESEFPARVERFELIPDSGGAGVWRGGLGFVRECRMLHDEVRFSMRTDKHLIAPAGVEGGKNGRKGFCIINPGAQEERRLPSRFGDCILKHGDLVRLERPGGGGMGDPFKRPPGKVLQDVRQGYVSVESARVDYGVALAGAGGQWRLDEEMTRALRKSEKKASK
jgi:N-methylhydantoinase B